MFRGYLYRKASLLLEALFSLREIEKELIFPDGLSYPPPSKSHSVPLSQVRMIFSARLALDYMELLGFVQGSNVEKPER